MFIAELDPPALCRVQPQHLRTGIMAGVACPTEVMKRVVEQMNLREITIAYGMTETSPVSCQSSTDTPLDKRVSTVGQVQPHLEIKIVDPETGATVPPWRAGEFCTKGYSVMHGYWEDPKAKTHEAIDADGWMHTGDLATMDAEGYVNIVGRIKDMVIRGGENIYPREIEEFCTATRRCRTCRWWACPTRNTAKNSAPGSSPSPASLSLSLSLAPGPSPPKTTSAPSAKGQIAHYKVPRYIRFVTSFPMTVTGKIQKFKIRDEMKDLHGPEENRTDDPHRASAPRGTKPVPRRPALGLLRGFQCHRQPVALRKPKISMELA